MAIQCHYVFFVITLLHHLPVRSTPACNTEVQMNELIPMFLVRGNEKTFVVYKMIVKPLDGENANTTECIIDTDVFLRNEENGTGPRLRAYIFGCVSTSFNIILNQTSEPVMDIVSYIQIQNCGMDISSIGVLANITRLTVMNIVHRSMLTATEPDSSCSPLDGIGTLLIANKKFPHLDMDIFYNCKEHLSFMAEIILRNLSLTELPELLPRYMPTLQSLDISVNRFTTPPVFPWDNSTRKLPHFLTRTTLFQNQYTHAGIIDISDGVYRREFRLDANPDLNLTGYMFRGNLQIISMERCRLRSLDTTLFYEVDELQFLSLSNNLLEVIPLELFQKSTSLRLLRIEGNRLTRLQAGVFKGLKEIVRLKIGNNRISHMDDGVFDGLFKLEKLGLENNQITFIGNKVFSKLLSKLKVVNLENNPLVEVPEGLFLMRSLYDIRLKGHNITDLDFARLDRNIDFNQLQYTVIDTVSSSSPNLDKPSDGLRTMDMSNGPLTRISFTPTDKYTSFRIGLLLKHFKFILSNNTIMCDCHILNFTRYVNELKENKTFGTKDVPLYLYGNEYAFDNWLCSKPIELSGRRVLQLKAEETYCPYLSENCPQNCSCYKRSVSGSIIVDCRGVGLTTAPESLPTGQTELWLQGNKIKHFNMHTHLSERVIELNLEGNSLERLDSRCISRMTNLKRLYIQDNLLASIPQEIRQLKLEVIKFGGNPLQCDCHSLWMKKWLIISIGIVQDYFNVKCVNFVEDTGKNILSIPDEDFICEEIPIYKIALPTVLPTLFVLMILITCLVLYIHWSSFKVSLYIHTGLHPFDKKDPSGVMCYDAFVVYPTCLSDWVLENIVQSLQNRHYTLFDVASDFKFGHSLQDNVQVGVQNSKRMILVLSGDAESDSLMQLALTAGFEKTREEKANFIVLLMHNSTVEDFKDEQLLKHIHGKKYVNTSSSKFFMKLMYYMPEVPIISRLRSKNTTITNTVYDIHTQFNVKVTIDTFDNAIKENMCVTNTTTDNTVSSITQYHHEPYVNSRKGSTIFVWYSDSDFRFMLDRIVKPLEDEGHEFILSDKSFIPGAAVQENILHAIQDSDRTIIILSQEAAADEWTLYVFRFASERQMIEKTFLTGIIVREGVTNTPCHEEIVKHLLSYQPLSERDRSFDRKLQQFAAPVANPAVLDQASDKETSYFRDDVSGYL